MKPCLACLKPLSSGKSRYHTGCLKRFWGKDIPQYELDFTRHDIHDLAARHIQKRLSITGVQPKISMGFIKTDHNKRLTIIGALEGGYILKPPFPDFPLLPEIEHVSMLMTQAAGIPTVPFLLIPLKDGTLAYLTKRIDRDHNGGKISMEDACQFTGKLTQHKYLGSYEQISKNIHLFCNNQLFDVLRFYQQVIICFLIGNNDAHLKNFSIIHTNGMFQLSPAYDMVAATILIPEDRDQLALNLNGKKRQLTRDDFTKALNTSQLSFVAQKNLWLRVEKGVQSWGNIIMSSLLDRPTKEILKTTIRERAALLSIPLKW